MKQPKISNEDAYAILFFIVIFIVIVLVVSATTASLPMWTNVLLGAVAAGVSIYLIYEDLKWRW